MRGALAAVRERRGHTRSRTAGYPQNGNEQPDRCPRCGGRGELNESLSAGGLCCLDCHLAAVVPSLAAARWRAKRSRSRRPARSTYTELVQHVWSRLEELTGRVPWLIERGLIAAYCPVCLVGTLAVRFIDAPGKPQCTFTNQGDSGCSYGCMPEQIIEVLR